MDTVHRPAGAYDMATQPAFKKLSWCEFERLLLLPDDTSWEGHAIAARPIKRTADQYIFRESPKISRRPLGREVDKWQNSGGKKGSTVSPDGLYRCRYGTVTATAGGATDEARKYVEVSFIDGTQLNLPAETRNRVVFQVLPQRRDAIRYLPSPLGAQFADDPMAQWRVTRDFLESVSPERPRLSPAKAAAAAAAAAPAVATTAASASAAALPSSSADPAGEQNYSRKHVCTC